MAERWSVGVVGAGTMGAGIAEVAARARAQVRLYDVDQAALARGQEAIAASLARAVERLKLSREEAEATRARISPTLDLRDLADCDVVIEAVPEDLEQKRRVFATLGEICRPDALLASNTSSLSITELAQGIPVPSRVLGLHFFNPAPIMRLVEVVRGELTSDETLRRGEDVARRFGKQPVVVWDSPGFIVNRVARPFYLEAFRLVGDGYADVPLVDESLRVAGFRQGPFELLDLIGIDVNLAVSLSLYRQTHHEPRFRPHWLQERMVRSGRLGRKTGQGFYDYRTETPSLALRIEARVTPPSGPWGEWAAEPRRGFVIGRVLAALINEAFWALGQGVASEEDIDLAMKLGTSWPRGPFEWTAERGIPLIVQTLRALREAHGEAYLPAPLLRQIASA